MALASKSGFNPALYMCNITRTVPSDAAQAQLEDIFMAAGKPLPAQDPQKTAPEHCSYCVSSSPADLPHSIAVLVKRNLPPIKTQFAALSLAFHYLAQGPPLGGRAPPHFV